MAVFIFHPANHADRRADGIGFLPDCASSPSSPASSS